MLADVHEGYEHTARKTYGLETQRMVDTLSIDRDAN